MESCGIENRDEVVGFGVEVLPALGIPGICFLEGLAVLKVRSEDLLSYERPLNRQACFLSHIRSHTTGSRNQVHRHH